MRHVQYAKYLQKIKQNEPEESKYVLYICLIWIHGGCLLEKNISLNL